MSRHKREAATPIADLQNEFPNQHYETEDQAGAPAVDDFLHRRGDYLRAQVAKIAAEHAIDDMEARVFFGQAEEAPQQQFRFDAHDNDASLDDTLIIRHI